MHTRGSLVGPRPLCPACKNHGSRVLVPHVLRLCVPTLCVFVYLPIFWLVCTSKDLKHRLVASGKLCATLYQGRMGGFGKKGENMGPILEREEVKTHSLFAFSFRFIRSSCFLFVRFFIFRFSFLLFAFCSFLFLFFFRLPFITPLMRQNGRYRHSFHCWL